MNGPVINGEAYAVVVLRVLEKDSFDRPKRVEVMYDDDSITVQEGMEFVTAFVMARVVAPKARGIA